jgi:acetyl-CoA carboxylase biotin carboxylase subunit
MGQRLKLKQDNVTFTGYAMECRITAEEVQGAFLPSYGMITAWHVPGGLGVRIDSSYRQGDVISPYYDSLVAKVCCYGISKEMVIKKMSRCLEEMVVLSIHTNIEFLRYIVNDKNFLIGNYNEKFVEQAILAFQVS